MCLLAPSAYVAHLSSTSLVNPQRNFHLLSIYNLLQSTAEAGQPAATSSHCHVTWRPRLPGQRVRQNIIPSKPMKPTTISAILSSLLSQVSQLCCKWSHTKRTQTQTHTYIWSIYTEYIFKHWIINVLALKLKDPLECQLFLCSGKDFNKSLCVASSRENFFTFPFLYYCQVRNMQKKHTLE